MLLVSCKNGKWHAIFSQSRAIRDQSKWYLVARIDMSFALYYENVCVYKVGSNLFLLYNIDIIIIFWHHNYFPTPSVVVSSGYRLCVHSNDHAVQCYRSCTVTIMLQCLSCVHTNDHVSVLSCVLNNDHALVLSCVHSMDHVAVLSCVHSNDHEYRLIKHLMADYDPRVRPSRNGTDALNVTFGMALAQIIDVVSVMFSCLLVTCCYALIVSSNKGQWHFVCLCNCALFIPSDVISFRMKRTRLLLQTVGLIR